MFVFHEREKQDMKLLSLQLCLLKAVLCCEDPRPVIFRLNAYTSTCKLLVGSIVQLSESAVWVCSDFIVGKLFDQHFCTKKSITCMFCNVKMFLTVSDTCRTCFQSAEDLFSSFLMFISQNQEQGKRLGFIRMQFSKQHRPVT